MADPTVPRVIFWFIGLVATIIIVTVCAIICKCCTNDSKNKKDRIMRNPNMKQSNGNMKGRRDVEMGMGSSSFHVYSPAYDDIGYNGGYDGSGDNGGWDSGGGDTGNGDIGGGCDTGGGWDSGGGGCDSGGGGCDSGGGGCDSGGGGCDSGGGGCDSGGGGGGDD